MSFLTLAFPTEAAIPAAQTTAGYARPLLGLGALATILIIFKPVMSGLFRAACLAIKPRDIDQQRACRCNLQGTLILNRMANELDFSQPNQAAELRLLAARGYRN